PSPRTSPRLQNPAPSLAGDALFLGARTNGRGELVFPFPGSGRVDDQSTVEAFLAGLDGWIQRTAPGPMDDVEAALGVRARTHRPDDLVEVRDVDVFVDHHGDATEVGPRATL